MNVQKNKTVGPEAMDSTREKLIRAARSPGFAGQTPASRIALRRTEPERGLFGSKPTHRFSWPDFRGGDMSRPVFISILFCVLNLNCAPASWAEATLTMDNYLNQVKGENGTYQGSVQNRDGAAGRAAEADLVTGLKLNGQFQFQKDQSIPQNPIITYDSVQTGTYSLGIEKVTTFGLDAKVGYSLSSIKYVDSNIVSLGGQDSIASASPSITLTQSLWQNGMGSLTRDTVEAKAAQAESDRFTSQSVLDATIQAAMSAYWTLVLQREVVAIRRVAVEQAKSIYDYNMGRAHMNLGEESDVLTAKASLESRNLDLQTALDDEETMRRSLNQYRNRPSIEDPGALSSIDWTYLTTYRLPDLYTDRADVESAKYQAQATAANSRILAENDRPVFNAFGSYALNGRSTRIDDSISNATAADRPTTTVGLTLSMPLDFTSVEKAKRGARAQAEAAATMYTQKARDQEADWQDLKAKVTATQRRVLLAATIEDAQKSKLEFEKKRLKQGRTSTYQILLFEQDYTTARLTRIQTASDMITLLSRARLYHAIQEGVRK